MNHNKTAVCIGAHPDDVEFSMGGTVAKLCAMGWKVVIIDITNGEPTPHGSPEIRKVESAAAARTLGVERITLPYNNRFLFDTIDARKDIATIIRIEKPSLMFVHYPVDAHPDHWAAHKLGMASRFYGKLSKTDMPGERHYTPRIFYFFSVHLKISPEPDFCVDISDYIQLKFDAAACYQSQFKEVKKKYFKNKNNATNDDENHTKVIESFITGYSRYWGMKTGCEHAEPFFSPEIFTLHDFSSII